MQGKKLIIAMVIVAIVYIFLSSFIAALIGLPPVVVFCVGVLVIGFIQQAFYRKQPISQELLVCKLERDEFERIYEQTEESFYKIQLGKFRDKLSPNDEIWVWRSKDSTWKALAGRQGYVILRNGNISKDYIVTGMN